MNFANKTAPLLFDNRRVRVHPEYASVAGGGQSTDVPCTYGIKEQWDVIGAARVAQQKGFSAGSFGVIG